MCISPNPTRRARSLQQRAPIASKRPSSAIHFRVAPREEDEAQEEWLDRVGLSCSGGAAPPPLELEPLLAASPLVAQLPKPSAQFLPIHAAPPPAELEPLLAASRAAARGFGDERRRPRRPSDGGPPPPRSAPGPPRRSAPGPPRRGARGPPRFAPYAVVVAALAAAVLGLCASLGGEGPRITH
jgi:hypothetical protein